ncbi:MAG: SNF2-related protein [Myxococcales bacterium]
MENLLDHLRHHGLGDAFPPDALDSGAAAVGQGRVSRPRVTGPRAAAYVADDRLGRCRAELRVGPDGLAGECSCGRLHCHHLAALSLMLTGGALPGANADDGSRGAATDPKHGERQRRAERARSGLFEVAPLDRDAAPYGRYQVSSPSGRTYLVTLRAFDQAHNSCTCQDFALNLLGTCKHVEAVIASLESRRSTRKLLLAARENGPRRSYLYLAHEPTQQVRLRSRGRSLAAARFARRWFDGDGEPKVASPDDWPEVLAEARQAQVEVPDEVDRHVSRSLQQAAQQRRVTALEARARRDGAGQPGFAGKLYPYQVEGTAFLLSRGRALLADDMGLGKTAQAIAAMSRLFWSKEIARALVVCPASLKHQWAQEISRFCAVPGVGTTVIGGSREQRLTAYAQAREIVVTSYELMRADEEEIGKLAPDLLVLDEAQRIKNWRTRTSDVVKRFPTRLAYVLTGTPLENRLDDLYSLMQVVDPHVFGPLWRFNQDFTSLDERGRVQGYRNLIELRARIAPHFLRRRKEEVLLQLPERLVSRLTVPLDEEQRAIHDEAESVVARILAVLRRRPLSPIEEKRLMAAFQRMRMSCDAARLVDDEAHAKGSAKLDELERLLEEILPAGRPQGGGLQRVGEDAGPGGPRRHAPEGGPRAAARRGPHRAARRAHRALPQRPGLPGLLLHRRRRRGPQPAGGRSPDQPRPALEPGGARPAHRPRPPAGPEEHRERGAAGRRGELREPHGADPGGQARALRGDRRRGHRD